MEQPLVFFFLILSFTVCVLWACSLVFSFLFAALVFSPLDSFTMAERFGKTVSVSGGFPDPELCFASSFLASFLFLVFPPLDTFFAFGAVFPPGLSYLFCHRNRSPFPLVDVKNLCRPPTWFRGRITPPPLFYFGPFMLPFFKAFL